MGSHVPNVGALTMLHVDMLSTMARMLLPNLRG